MSRWVLPAFLLLPIIAHAQLGVTTFGIQVKPVLPLEFFDPVTTFSNGELSGSTELKGGYSFGMLVRTGISEMFTMEIGINQIQRRYDWMVMNDTSGFTAGDDLKWVGYELPIRGLIFIRLGERTYMNNALGLAIDMYPSDAERFIRDAGIRSFRSHWAQFAVEGNIGVEYRTERSGYFYLGASYHRPFNNMADVQLYWLDSTGLPYRIQEPISGTYLTIDLRYFFHEDPDKRALRRGG